MLPRRTASRSTAQTIILENTQQSSKSRESRFQESEGNYSRLQRLFPGLVRLAFTPLPHFGKKLKRKETAYKYSNFCQLYTIISELDKQKP